MVPITDSKTGMDNPTLQASKSPRFKTAALLVAGLALAVCNKEPPPKDAGSVPKTVSATCTPISGMACPSPSYLEKAVISNGESLLYMDGYAIQLDKVHNAADAHPSFVGISILDSCKNIMIQDPHLDLNKAQQFHLNSETITVTPSNIGNNSATLAVTINCKK